MQYIDKQKIHDDLETQIIALVDSDRPRYYRWLKYYRANESRVPLYPGSKIRDAATVLMREFLAI
jgi:hypothetical protein